MTATSYRRLYRSFSGIKSLFAYIFNVLPVVSSHGTIYFVDSNIASSGDGSTWAEAFKTMAEAFAVIDSGDTILVRGNITENLTTPTGAADVSIIGVGTRPRHADTHPLNGELSTATWRAASDAPLCIVRNPGWKFENILFAAHASDCAIQLERNAVEDATEQDASHMSVIGCRFASGQSGINDTGGCSDVLVENCLFEALTGYCIRGVGNIGAGQGWWNVLGNHFTGFTNGVYAAFYNSIIKGNCFTDGGTPGTTIVLNTVNALHGNNFVVDNYFQTATANFATPDIAGNATDVWNNTSIDGTANMIGREVGQPA
jgi:hypothetical protein